MPTITKKSPAKINLFLHITGKRADGYHNLQTVFRLINFYDTLTFTISQNKIGNNNTLVTLQNADAITEDIENNLIVKASRALLSYAIDKKILSTEQIQQLPIINIHLDKKIPMGAGLGGGSSNCATTLLTLNELWQLDISNEQLRQVGATLGADVPIFIFGQDAIAEGIGEILTPIQLPPQKFLLLAPDEHINTAKLFANPLLKRDCQAFSHAYLQHHLDEFMNKLTYNFCNVFEPVVCSQSINVKNALSYLKKFARSIHTSPRMTGSGSCVFLPISNNIDDNTLQPWITHSPCPAYLVNSL